MSCILIRYTYDKNLEMILLPSGTYVQSFGSIAPAVTKRALLTDDGQRTPHDCIGR
jgi:hypothetical protein